MSERKRPVGYVELEMFGIGIRQFIFTDKWEINTKELHTALDELIEAVIKKHEIYQKGTVREGSR